MDKYEFLNNNNFTDYVNKIQLNFKQILNSIEESPGIFLYIFYKNLF